MNTTKNSRYTERRIQSRNAGYRLEAARVATLLAFFGSFGVVLSVYSGIFMKATTGSALLLALGLSVLAASTVGIFVYWSVLMSLVNDEDVVIVDEEPEEIDEIESRPVGPGVHKNQLLIANVPLRVSQWRAIYEAINDNDGSISRALVEKATKDKKIKNLNAKYGELTRWMLDKGFIVDTEPDRAYPNYYLTEAGHMLFNEAIQGRTISG